MIAGERQRHWVVSFDRSMLACGYATQLSVVPLATGFCIAETVGPPSRVDSSV
jgi:hypothetical protein